MRISNTDTSFVSPRRLTAFKPFIYKQRTVFNTTEETVPTASRLTFQINLDGIMNIKSHSPNFMTLIYAEVLDLIIIINIKTPMEHFH